MRIQNILATLFAGVLCTSCIVLSTTQTKPTTTTVVAPYPTTPLPPTVAVTGPTTTTPYGGYASAGYDISYDLDLHAVAAAFGESRTVEDFERILNTPQYYLNNLDLNRDGYIDYLRVLETRSGKTSVLLIQACLARNVYQDVATLVAERTYDAMLVQVIGDPYLYGRNYIIEPVWLRRPNIYNHMDSYFYSCWTSRYGWDYYPSYYNRPRCMLCSQYQNYMTSYLHNHSYCHTCYYRTEVHYVNYQSVCSGYQRRDYAAQHPDRSFDNRYNSSNNGTRYVNTSDLRNQGSTSSVRPGSSNNTQTTTTRPATTTNSPASGTTTTTRPTTNTTTTTSTVRPATGTTTTTTRPAAGTTTSTTTTTRPATNTTTTTSTVRPATGTTTTNRQITTTTKSTATATKSATTTKPATTTKTSKTTSTRSGSTTTTTRSGSTTTTATSPDSSTGSSTRSGSTTNRRQ